MRGGALAYLEPGLVRDGADLQGIHLLEAADAHFVLLLALGHGHHVGVQIQRAARDPRAVGALRVAVGRVGHVPVEVSEVAELERAPVGSHFYECTIAPLADNSNIISACNAT